MASLINGKLRFLHLPKTGGSWATEAMFAAGVVAHRPARVPFHGGLPDSRDFSDRFTFAFVRHPLEFWLSYWGYRMRTGWDSNSTIDAGAASADFPTFVEGILDCAPGFASALYEQYVGRPGEEIDFIGRYERLADDLCLALSFAGQEFSERRLRAYPPVNHTDFGRYPVLYTPRAAERLAEAERISIDRFYAHDPIPAHLLGARRAARPPIAERLLESEIQLRDAHAELAARRRADQRRKALLDTSEQELADALQALSSLRASHLVRWSRPVRARWYALRGRVSARHRTHLALRRPWPTARELTAVAPSCAGAPRCDPPGGTAGSGRRFASRMRTDVGHGSAS